MKTFDLFETSFLYENLETNVWLPVTRRYNFGPMAIRKPGADYAEIFHSDQYVPNFLIKANCMIVTNNTLQYANCSDKYPHLCAYHANSKESCSDRTTTSFQSCFCESIGSESQEDDEENEDEKCELELDDVKMAKVPETTGENVCYYVTFNDKNFACRVREMDIPEVRLILKFDVKKKTLLLTVYSPEGE